MSNKEKIDIAAILKDCPRGMELDCTIYDDVTLDSVVFESEYHYENTNTYPIKIVTKSGFSTRLTKYGQNVDIAEAKCMIFPKGKTTWEGFTPPCQFKDGDIVFYDNCVSIFKEWGDATLFRSYVKVDIDSRPMLCDKTHSNGKGIKREARFATEEEKEKLFNVINEKGYKWVPETKTLMKFKDGDILYIDANDEGDDDDCFKYTFILKEMDGHKVIAHCYTTAEDYFKPRKVYLTDNNKYPIRFATEDEKKKLFDAIKEDGLKWNVETKTLEELNVPRFNVGDRIQWHDPRIDRSINVIKSLESDSYRLDDGSYIKFGDEYEYKLLKFDINTLKTFDKVLVRETDCDIWVPKLFSHYETDLDMEYHVFFSIDDLSYYQCIPYEGNEHLSRQTDNCDGFYRVWEK